MSWIDARASAAELSKVLRSEGKTLATAESCTGGMVGMLLTEIPGSSDVYVGGAIAYANEAKRSLLGVDPGAIAEHGAVSAIVAEQMAEGARARLGTDAAVSITGIAGPRGGTADKPVGLVYVGWATSAGTGAARHVFPGDRDDVRTAAARAALERARSILTQP